MKHVSRLFISALMVLAVSRPASAAVETMAEYADSPFFMSNSVLPNIMILADNSGSMDTYAYLVAYSAATTYSGYFSPTSHYSFFTSATVSAGAPPINTYTGYFYIDPAGPWLGSFLNWATMRRIDIARKVLVGGLASPARAGTGVDYIIGETTGGDVHPVVTATYAASTTAWNADATHRATYSMVITAAVPYLSVKWETKVAGVWGTTATYKYQMKVKKEFAKEPNDFVNNSVAGIVQKISTKARFGLTFFEISGSAIGGKVKEPIGAVNPTGYSPTFITNYELNSSPKTMTPLAETMWEILGYFKQNAAMRVDATYYPVAAGTVSDPFYFSDANMLVPCGKNYVIIITDGDPTDDDFSDFPAATTKPAVGSRTLDAIALAAHTTDLRADISSTQVLTIYTVYTFGDTASGRTLLNNTAKNGGFIDSNGSNTPDLLSEWHTTTKTLPDGTPQADNFFPADSADEMESQIMAAFTDILKRASSGTAISVLATSASGAGNIFQAYFLPSKTIVDALGSRDVTWIGHLLSLQVDNNGSLLDKNNACINFSFNAVTNSTDINTLGGTMNACGTNITAVTPLTNFTNYNWDAGVLLSSTAASSRTIFTFRDINKNNVVDAGEKLDFTTANAGLLQKYLRTSSLAEATNVIDWVRGTAVSGYRDRTINVGGDQWKLGDIIHSTPTVVGAPQEAYSSLYQDASYETWYTANKNRTTMVYIGANDGMLHAFNATTGAEAWAYIPYNLLPHLKWLADPSYPHVDYVDLKVKITDANFGTSGSPNWKTVLIGGMRFGGGEITDTSYDVDVDGDAAANLRKWRSAFFAIDITDPAIPVPLWEWNPGDNTLGFAMTYPAVAKVGDEFFAIVGSGPKAAYIPVYDGTSIQTASLFVLNIRTGALAATFPVSDPNAFFSDPISVDIDFTNSNAVVGGSGGVSYNADAIYVGETYKTVAGVWNSRMWRIITNPTGAGNDVNPAHWLMYDLYNNAPGQYITSAPAATTDSSKNFWLFYGTGKYLNGADKSDVSQQAFYGIKDPCWDGSNAAWRAACLAPNTWGSLNTASAVGAYTGSITSSATLVNTSGAVVATDSANTVTGVAGAGTFSALKTLISTKDGWYTNFSLARERALNKPTIIGGMALFTTFVPDSDVCALGGNSWFYAIYYETGSAYSSSVIGTSGGTVLSKSATSSVGMASSIAVHAGRESGAKAYVQMSTGQASVININTALSIKSGIVAWREL